MLIKTVGTLDENRHSQMNILDPSGITTAVDAMHDTKKILSGGGEKVNKVWYEPKQCYIAIRRLTPKECFRLQGWDDEYFERAFFVNYDSQLYKQAGNGVTVTVVKAIAERME